MFRFALPLSGALVAACFVDAPPAGTAATGTSSSTASDTTTAGTLGMSASTSAGASTTRDGSSGGATSGASSGASGLVGSSTLADHTSSSSDGSTGTTAGSGSSGSLVPPECPETLNEYTCTACCAEAHSGAKIFFAALAPCLCVIGEGCLLACADLCDGGFPNELCYSTCVLVPPDAQCGDAALAECAKTPDCAAFLNCYTTSDCANKP